MARLLNRNHLPTIPLSFRGKLPNGKDFVIPWRSQFIPWSGFVSTVTKFHRDNGMEPPSEDQIDEQIAAQVPKTFRADSGGYGARVVQRAAARCKGCGKW